MVDNVKEFRLVSRLNRRRAAAAALDGHRGLNSAGIFSDASCVRRHWRPLGRGDVIGLDPRWRAKARMPVSFPAGRCDKMTGISGERVSGIVTFGGMTRGTVTMVGWNRLKRGDVFRMSLDLEGARPLARAAATGGNGSASSRVVNMGLGFGDVPLTLRGKRLEMAGSSIRGGA